MVLKQVIIRKYPLFSISRGCLYRFLHLQGEKRKSAKVAAGGHCITMGMVFVREIPLRSTQLVRTRPSMKFTTKADKSEIVHTKGCDLLTWGDECTSIIAVMVDKGTQG